MRCPKCGYITFDFLEQCRKCNRSISEAARRIGGTIYQASPPAFLSFDAQPEPPQDQEATMEVSLADEPTVELDMTTLEDVDTDEETQVEIDLGAETDDDVFAEEELDTDFELQEESAIDDDQGLEPDLPAGKYGTVLKKGTEQEEEIDPRLHFSDLDISDLGPPGREIEKPAPEPVAGEETIASSLDDMELDDLKIDTSDRGQTTPAADRGAGKRRTGTALDEFDVSPEDLGDLL